MSGRLERTNVTLPVELKQRAKALGINVSEECRAGLRRAVLAAERDAIAARARARRASFEGEGRPLPTGDEIAAALDAERGEQRV